ncbi:CLIPB9.2 family protein [Megaselia abdita]
MKYKLNKFRFLLLSHLFFLFNKVLCGDRELPSPPDCGSIHSITKRVIGGTYSRSNEFPWMVLLEYQKGVNMQNGCGGVLINKQFVLTAVHCLNNKHLGQLISVKLGVHNQLYNGTRMRVERTILHEDFHENDNGILFNDIALLRLENNIDYSSSIYPICMPFMTDYYQAPELGTNFTVAGWGETQMYYSSKRLRKVIVPFVSRRACKKLFYRKYGTFIPSTNICAGGEEGRDSCYGDSGGPLMRKIRNYWLLEGIISYGDTDQCATEMPTVHAYVSKYKYWIVEHIRNG